MKTKNQILAFLLLIGSQIGLLTPSSIAAPNFFRFQGRLTDKDGSPIVGRPRIKFRLFEVAEEGSPLWETQGFIEVPTNAVGLFSAEVGPLSFEDFVGREEVYLEVVVRGRASDQPMKPRQKLGSVAFAFDSHHAEIADIATSVSQNAINSESIENGEVKSEDIAQNAIGSDQIKNGGITFIDLAADTVRSENIKNGGIELIDLSPSIRDSFTLKDGSIQSNHIATGSVMSHHIENRTINNSHIEFETITTMEIKDGTIQNIDIKDDAVTSEKIADGSIEAKDLKEGFGFPRGGIMIWSGLNCPNGYKRFSAMDGRYPLGEGGILNKPISESSDQIDHSHESARHGHSLEHTHGTPNHTHVLDSVNATSETEPVEQGVFRDRFLISQRSEGATLFLFDRPGNWKAWKFKNQTQNSGRSTTLGPSPHNTGFNPNASTSKSPHLPPFFTIIFCQKE